MAIDEYFYLLDIEINSIYMNLRIIENWFDSDKEKQIPKEDFLKKIEIIATSSDKALDISNQIEDIITTSEEFYTLMQLRLREIYSCAKIACTALKNDSNDFDCCYYDDLSQILLKWIKKVKEYSMEIPKYK